MKEKMPYGLRKYLRREKARIRKMEKNFIKRAELIGELYKKLNFLMPKSQ